MPNLGGIAKYLSLFSIGKGFIDKIIVQKLLIGVAGIVGLSVIAAILVGSLILAALSGIYLALTEYTELSQLGALSIVGVIVVALITVIVFKIIEFSRRISSFSTVLIQSATPTSPIADVVNAFVSGLKEPHLETGKSKRYPRPVK